jgi:hypothetical protein
MGLAVEDPTVLSTVPASPVGIAGGGASGEGAVVGGVEARDVEGKEKLEEEEEEAAPLLH